MKVVITGSLGHISKPLSDELINKGHDVTVISSKVNKQKEIEAIGAKAAIGSVDDVDFLTSAFNDADVVYCMVPPNFSEPDQTVYYERISENYAAAIQQAGIKRVILLSSYGAHLEKGTGFIVGSHRAEKIFSNLKDVAVTNIRPGYFYYNLFNFISMIKHAGFIGANYGDNDRLVLVSPKDIATVIADEITTPSTNNKVRYVVSDERTCRDIADVLGTAINKPGLQWKTLSNKEMQNGLEANGFPKVLAPAFVELGEAIHTGILLEDYDKHQPVFGTVKIEDFAQEFAAAYNNNTNAAH